MRRIQEKSEPNESKEKSHQTPQKPQAGKPPRNSAFARPSNLLVSSQTLSSLLFGLTPSAGEPRNRAFSIWKAVLCLRKMLGNGKAFWVGFMLIAGAITASAQETVEIRFTNRDGVSHTVEVNRDIRQLNFYNADISSITLPEGLTNLETLGS